MPTGYRLAIWAGMRIVLVMPESQPQNLTGLYRQVVVRVPAADVPRLEAAAREYGSIQAAFLAALRALPVTVATRPAIEAAPPPPAGAPPATPVSTTASRPGVASPRPGAAAVAIEAERWVGLDRLAGQLDLSAASLRRRAKRDGALRGRGPTAQVNVDQLVVERYLAARLVGVTSQTIRRWILKGQLSNLHDAQAVRLGEVYPPR